MAKRAERKALAVSAKLESRGLHAFVWRKKIERDLSRGIQPQITSFSLEKKRCLDRLEEIEQIKKPRFDLALLRSQFKDEQFVVSKSMKAKDAEFDLNQSRIRSEIRLNSGRAKPIDILLQFLCKIGKHNPKLDNPLLIFTGSDLKELKELKDDIEMHLAIDKTNSLFWEYANLVCNWKIQGASGGAHANALQSSEISSEVTSVIENKTYAQLEYMQQQLEKQMKSGEVKAVEFWESVLNYVMIYKAKRYLEENYSSDAIKPRDTQPENSEISRTNSLKNEEDLISEHSLKKPKYIFRVHTGFQWNKYNRIHYDHDHPPPKTVKGYSFIIHYPEFCGETPQYSIEKDIENSLSCLVRFYAGPPYEDVVFRIVNKEWDRSWKSGFRCTFWGGILRLNFFFKQFSYRR